MATRIPLNVPDIGDADRIELVAWSVATGAAVEEHQELCELVTEKAAFPLESPYRGRVVELCAKAGALVRVGELLAILETEAAPNMGPSNG